MSNNSTFAENDGASSSSSGLVAGLSVLSLLVVVVAGVIVYKYRSKFSNMVRSLRTKSQTKGDIPETTPADPNKCTAFIREESPSHMPIYENLKTQRPNYSWPAEDPKGSPGDTEEGLYLQCDLSDNGIYSNDPKCHLAILHDPQEEDVYIMPDS